MNQNRKNIRAGVLNLKGSKVSQEVMKVHTAEMMKAFRSKDDLFRILLVEGNICLAARFHCYCRIILLASEGRMHSRILKRNLQWK